MLSPDTVIVHNGDLVSAPLGEETAMLDVDSGNYYILDDVASAIWEGLATETTPARLCAQLLERFDVTPAQCETDVMRFLDTLHGKGLVRIVD
jgi:hypothetical protein